MDALIVIIALWVLGSYVFAALAPLLFELLGYAIAFIFECACVALLFVLRGAGIALTWACRKAARGMGLGFLFLSILIEEWRRGPEDQQAYDDDDDDDDLYEAARDLLGLRPGFTRKAFERAYKAAMKRAHPDAGGTTAQAQKVNKARETIRRAHGWA